MINGGVSIKGSYHDINQDYFICKPFKEGYVLVVSDGMGSKNMSQYGSKAICESIYYVINNYKKNIQIASFKEFLFFVMKNGKKD